jgi:hypothetical protein
MLTEREVKMAQLTVEGCSQREIGEMMSMTQQNVSRILNTEEVRAIVDEAQQIIATGAKLAAENMVGAAEYFGSYLAKLKRGGKPETDIDKQMVDYGYKASREIGKATGSLAGEGTSIFIQNIYKLISKSSPKRLQQITPFFNAFY